MNIVANATEVLIFKKNSMKPNKGIERYLISGIVQKSTKSDNISYHGSPKYEQIYYVLGIDGRLYKCEHLLATNEDYYICTIEEYITKIYNQIYNNYNEVDEIIEANKELNKTLDYLITKEEEKERNSSKVKTLIKEFK